MLGSDVGVTVGEAPVTSRDQWRRSGICVPVTSLALVARATLTCMSLVFQPGPNTSIYYI